MKAALVSLGLLALLLGCATTHRASMVRVEHGQLVASRVVPAPQYEAFFRGELARNRGDFEAARAHYEVALANGDSDALLRARYLESLCRTESVDRARAFWEREMQHDAVSSEAICNVTSEAPRAEVQRAVVETAAGAHEVSPLMLEEQFLFGPLMTPEIRSDYERTLSAPAESNRAPSQQKGCAQYTSLKR